MRRAHLQLGHPRRVGSPHGRKPPPQGGARRRREDVRGERPADARGRVLERVQNVLGLDLHRCLRHLGRDRRIAVAIAPDPAAEPKERRRQRWPAAASSRIQRAVESAVDLGHGTEQGFVEDRHHGAHLVEGLQLGRPQLPGAPQQVDLFEQPAPRLDELAGRGRGIVEALEPLTDPPDSRHDRSPPRFRRMGCENRVDLEPTHQLAQALAPELPAQMLHRRRERLGQGIRTLVALLQNPRSVVLLGKVGQVEVARERLRHLLRALDRPAGDKLLRGVLGAR